MSTESLSEVKKEPQELSPSISQTSAAAAGDGNGKNGIEASKTVGKDKTEETVVIPLTKMNIKALTDEQAANASKEAKPSQEIKKEISSPESSTTSTSTPARPRRSVTRKNVNE